ncbi:YceI family protein [Chitinophaga cymbidii]|uniref:Polyisoprenoid-binding protein n=1 Tax=Chitinophaga cymbidii TaxID=1096750 RepID=A0A512RP87_9BACT|nr:YceI family protein [Chitinophaga cymbidii]GEP97501.1 polyisoprenoid-binding protein [Chitinophaga cymbidii]
MQRTAALFLIGGAVALMSFINKPTAVYRVDNQQSTLNWTAKKVTGQHTGTISVSEGTLEVENNALKGGAFTLDTRTITVTDITNPDMNKRLLGHLKNDDFFAVDKHPSASFVITSAVPKGNGNYDVTGKLTIKSITNNITFPAHVVVANGKATAKATITVDRTKFDIKYRSKNFFENLGDKTIYDDFELDVTLVANAQ